MKRNHLFIIVVVILFLFIAASAVYFNLDYETTHSDYVLVGDNNDFDARVVTDGRDTFYMWNRRLRHNMSGSTDIDIYYIGDKDYGPGSDVEYFIDLGALSSGGSHTIDDYIEFNPNIISISKENFLRAIPEDLSIFITIDNDEYVINFSEQ